MSSARLLLIMIFAVLVMSSARVSITHTDQATGAQVEIEFNYGIVSVLSGLEELGFLSGPHAKENIDNAYLIGKRIILLGFLFFAIQMFLSHAAELFGLLREMVERIGSRECRSRLSGSFRRVLFIALIGGMAWYILHAESKLFDLVGNMPALVAGFFPILLCLMFATLLFTFLSRSKVGCLQNSFRTG